MGLLNRDERRTLAEVLDRMLFTRSAEGRRLLLLDLPPGLVRNPELSRSDFNINTMLALVDGPEAVPMADGKWPILLFIENAIDNGIGDANDLTLRALLNTAQSHALGTATPASITEPPPLTPPERTPMRTLTGAEKDDLAQVLTAALSSGDLGRLARRVFDQTLDSIVAPGNLQTVSQQLVEFAERQDKLRELIVTARSINGSNIRLKTFAATVGAEGGEAVPPVTPMNTPTNPTNESATGESGVVGGNAGVPQPAAQTKPTTDELNRVRLIIRDNLVIGMAPQQIVQFLRASGLSTNLIAQFQWVGLDANATAGQIVDLAIRQGKPINGKAGFTVLGLIMDEILNQQLVGYDDGLYLATMIVRYNLVDVKTAKTSDTLQSLLQVQTVFDPGQAEKAIIGRQFDNFIDVVKWLRDGLAVVRTVCRFLIPFPNARTVGSGFLVGPDLVLTNYHVVKDLVEATQENRGTLVPPDSVAVQFGYKVSDDGRTVEQGQMYRLATDWLLDSRPFNDLDYALVRLAAPAGNENAADGQPRHWLTAAPRALQQGESLYIVQHPLKNDGSDSEPLKVVLASNAVTAPTPATATRLQYLTQTRPGSSGSPCFSDRWELVALHHASAAGNANEGIPIGPIVSQPKVAAALPR